MVVKQFVRIKSRFITNTVIILYARVKINTFIIYNYQSKTIV